jgi:hypothetical protein
MTKLKIDVFEHMPTPCSRRAHLEENWGLIMTVINYRPSMTRSSLLTCVVVPGRGGSHLSLVHVLHVAPHTRLFVGTLSQCTSLVKWWCMVQPLWLSIYIGLLGPLKQACNQYNSITCSIVPLWYGLQLTHKWGLPPWSLEYPHHSPWPYDTPLSSCCPTQSQIKPSILQFLQPKPF